jgi:hypothetical protein
MNADEIFNATKEMHAVFAEYGAEIVKRCAEATEKGLPTPDIEELHRAYAMKGLQIVVKHDKWPADLNAQLKKVVAYIEANQGRNVEGHERVQG